METFVEFEVERATLRGVLARPEGDAARGDGVVFLHGWSGCRLGPQRLFVRAARRLAAAGVASLRFDFRGRGESDGDAADAAIRGMIDDAQAAAALMAAQPGVRRVVLAGICSGAKVAIGAAAGGAPVGGLALWSAEALGPLRTPANRRRKSLAVLRDYARKLVSPRSWARLLGGRANVAMIRKAVLQSEAPNRDELAAEAAILRRFSASRAPALFVYGAADPDAALTQARYREFCAGAGVPARFHDVAGANHNFSSLAWQEAVLSVTEGWLRGTEP